jgi:signal transduction histidine kinase
MTTGRLTRQELGWLLAQEARGAAKLLRQDVTLLTQPPPADASAPAVPSLPPDARFETTLNALDDAIGLLSELETGGAGAKARRGRIDLAALVIEHSPNANVSIEPGAGIEVFGDEAELRRMLHVLVSQTNSPGGGNDAAATPIRFRRENEWVRITADLGPDVSANTELERRWMSRMATRLGGRLELEGGTMSLLLPADASADQSEVADLRKELEQAQQLGEVYARELAAALTAGQLPEVQARTDRRDVAERRFELMIGLASAVHRTLLPVLRALNDAIDRLEPEPASGLSMQVSTSQELLGELSRLANCPFTESVERVDIGRVLREAMLQSEARAVRHDVALALEAPEHAAISTRPKAAVLLVRSLVEHAVLATPRGGRVLVSLGPVEGGAVLRVHDGGPVVPASAHRDVLEHRVDPTTLGRPPGLGLVVAHTTAAYLGGGLRLLEGAGGAGTGFVVEATFGAA